MLDPSLNLEAAIAKARGTGEEDQKVKEGTTYEDTISMEGPREGRVICLDRDAKGRCGDNSWDWC